MSMRRVLRMLLWLVGAVLLAVLMWVGFANVARATRETQTVEQLAWGQGRWVLAGDAKIYLQEWGEPSAPVMLLTHGTGASSGTWFELPAALAAAGWRVVAMDLPPFGLSATTGEADYSRAAQARRVLAVIDSLKQPVTLVGHSFGAGPALEAALRAKNRLRQLVLVDPALGLGAQGEAPACERSDGWMAEAMAIRELRTTLLSATATWPGLSPTLLRQFVHRKEAVNEQRVPAYQRPFSREGFTAGLGDWAAAFANSSCESTDSLDPNKLTAWARSGPAVALIWGDEDTITPLAQAHALKRWMPNATLATLPGVGHIPHIEAPAEFAAALIQATASARSR